MSKSPDSYKPVYKSKDGIWKRINQPALIITKESGELEINFDFMFEDSDPVYFAFSYPWTYEEN